MWTRSGTTSGRRSTRVSSSSQETRREKRARKREATAGAWYPKWYWPSFASAGTIWMLVLFLLPFYVVVSIAFGTVDPIFQSPLPVYEHWFWPTKYLGQEWHLVTGQFRAVEVSALLYVIVARALSVLVAYPVTFY